MDILNIQRIHTYINMKNAFLPILVWDKASFQVLLYLFLHCSIFIILFFFLSVPFACIRKVYFPVPALFLPCSSISQNLSTSLCESASHTFYVNLSVDPVTWKRWISFLVFINKVGRCDCWFQNTSIYSVHIKTKHILYLGQTGFSPGAFLSPGCTVISVRTHVVLMLKVLAGPAHVCMYVS